MARHPRSRLLGGSAVARTRHMISASAAVVIKGGGSPTLPPAASYAVTVTTAASRSPAQGRPDDFGAIFAGGVSQAYLALVRAGGEETSSARQLVDASSPWATLVPQSSGSYVCRAYDALTGGSIIGESAAMTVAPAPAIVLPLPLGSLIAANGDSTMMQSIVAQAPTYTVLHRTGVGLTPLLAIAGGLRMVNWPSYYPYPTDAGRNYDGSIEASSGGVSPGQVSRHAKALMTRARARFTRVTVNDVAFGTSVAAATTAYQTLMQRSNAAGEFVIFLSMPPYPAGVLDDSASRQKRVDLNTAVRQLAIGNAAGAIFLDTSSVYLAGATYQTPGGPMGGGYADATLIDGFHPRNTGAAAEMRRAYDLLVTAGVIAPGQDHFWDTFGVGGAQAARNLAPDPTFIATTAGVAPVNGMTGTVLAALSRVAASGPGSGRSTAVASVETGVFGGSSHKQRLVITPNMLAAAGTVDTFTLPPARLTSGVANAGVGMLATYVRVTVTDPEKAVDMVSFQADGLVASTSYGASKGAGGNGFASPDGSARTYLIRADPLVLSGIQTRVDSAIQIAVLPSGKVAAITVDIEAIAMVDLATDPIVDVGGVGRATIAARSAATSTTVPITVTLPVTGPMPTSIRTYRATQASPQQTFVSEVLVPPGATSVDIDVAHGFGSAASGRVFVQCVMTAGVVTDTNTPAIRSGTSGAFSAPLAFTVP